MKNPLTLVTDFLWHPRWTRADPMIQRLVRLLRYPFALIRDSLHGELNLRAMSLVYTTMLSLVPLIALSFSLLKAFEFHYELGPILISILAPLGAKAGELSSNIINFVDNVQGAALGSVGLAFLIFTVISMVQKVEESFNFVWQVTKSRSIVRRVSEFMSLILVAPVLMLVALGLLGTLSADAITSWLLQYDWIKGGTVWLSQWIPLLLISTAFSFLYGFMPNTKVTAKAAIVGGVCGGILWTLAGKIFQSVVAGSAQYTAIYSTFAIVIIALIWLYIGWLILLIGAKISFYAQNPQYLRHGRQRLQIGTAKRERLAIALMIRVARNFQSVSTGANINEIAAQLHVTGNLLAPIAQRLEKDGLITRTADAKLIPARALGTITLIEVVNSVRVSNHDRHISATGHPGPTDDAVNDIMNSIDDSISSVLGTTTLHDLMTY
ncbi:MAG: YhjD/YihY/BrkB family envelope integrity protein [Gammaproteobacteria bacterium]